VQRQGAVRTAHEAGWVTPLATLGEGRALRENDRQHMAAAQGSGRVQGDSLKQAHQLKTTGSVGRMRISLCVTPHGSFLLKSLGRKRL
jgi:hypothetical protein